jgi:hypothetical protein
MKNRNPISETWHPLVRKTPSARLTRVALWCALLSIGSSASIVEVHASRLRAPAHSSFEGLHAISEGTTQTGKKDGSDTAPKTSFGDSAVPSNEFRMEPVTKGGVTPLLLAQATRNQMLPGSVAKPSSGRTDMPSATSAPARWGIPKDSARFFVSGHSLTGGPYASNIADIARSLVGPQAAKFNEQLILGSPIRLRTGAPKNNDGYSTGYNWPGGEGLDVRKELRSGATINGDRYDTLVITENHNLIQNLQWESTVKQTRHFHEQLIAGNSNGTTFLHASWWDIDKARPRGWIEAERALAPVWQCVASRINQSLIAEGRKDRVRPLPTSLALTYLVERALNGQIEGISSGSPKATLNKIFSDNVHLTSVGSYYMSLVTFAAIYQRSPQGAPPAEGVSKEQAELLQSMAWSFVSGFYAKYEDPSLTDCNTRWAPAACVPYWTERGEPGSIRECQALFQASNRENPFFYNPQTDANFWFPSKP